MSDLEKQLRAVALRALIRIRDFGPNERYGICTNLASDAELLSFRRCNDSMFEFKDGIYRWSEDFVASIAKDWPHFSGDTMYPVPKSASGSHQCNAADMYHASYSIGTLWKGEYGRLRIDLLLFLIAKLEEELK